MDIAVERRPRGEDVELAVAGRLDAESAGELRHAVAAEIRRGSATIALDLAGVAFLSSAGIRVLFETQREARAAGGDCLIATASEPVRKVLELTRLDRILMRPAVGPMPVAVRSAAAGGRDVDAAGVRLIDFEAPPGGSLRGRVHGSTAALAARTPQLQRLRLPPHAFALGIGGVADEHPLRTAGEMLAAGGTVYHRGPRPFVAVDYLAGSGDLVAEADIVAGLSWEGLPGGRAVFEPTDEGADVAIDDLAAALLAESGAETLALVVAGEVHGLVAAELIRPLAEATPGDHPLVGTRAVTAEWLCFSREPVHAGRTALALGVVTRATGGPLADSVAPLGPAGVAGHLHTVVFPHRPIRPTGGDLAPVLADLAASEPLAVLHLMADERPVLGRGTSGFVRGVCWFAPLTVVEGGA